MVTGFFVEACCHSERSEESPGAMRSFASLRMTKRRLLSRKAAEDYS
jgi:hypothetical protein